MADSKPWETQPQEQLTPLELWRQTRAQTRPQNLEASLASVHPDRLNPEHILYGTAGPLDADIMIVGESWGENEAKKRQPFVGNTGMVLDELLLGTEPNDEQPCRRAIRRDECFITNVIPAQPAGNDVWRFFHNNWEVKENKWEVERQGLYPKPIVLDGLRRLKAQIELVKPKLIIGLGNYVLWALTESNFGIGTDDKTSSTKVPTGIGTWRGSHLRTSAPDMPQGIPFLPTFHPASTFHQYSNKFLIQQDLLARVPKALHDEWDAPTWEFIVRPSFEETLATIDMLLRLADIGPLELSVDIETRLQHISCCGLAWNRHEAICIPFMTTERLDGNCAYWHIDEEIEIVVRLRGLLSHANVRIIGQNFLYDAQYFALYWGFIPHISFDTMLTHHVLWPGTPRGLDYLSSLYCKHHLYWKDDGKDWQSSLGEETNWIYNCTDCVRTYEVAQELKLAIEREDMREPFLFQHVRANELALPMMLRGVLVDKQRRLEAGLQLIEAVEERYLLVDEMIPEDIWPRVRKKNGKLKDSPWYRSPKQQQTIFYEVLTIKPVINRKTKRPTLNAEAIAVLKKREPIIKPIIQSIEEIRSLNKFQEFIVMPLDPDDRMRCYFDPSGTETFRYSSRENAFGRGGNLENISKGREEEEETE